ncbi:MAG: hypothetical protein JWM78_2303 [Verrucomicrobiaceae bacterium]|nr:hypothetical protein [Verrucomicrobiaceae bacterium]
MSNIFYRLNISNFNARQRALTLRPSALALSILGGVSVFASAPLHAADDPKTNAELQAEVIRLKQEVEFLRSGKTVAEPQPSATKIQEPIAETARSKNEATSLGKVVVKARRRNELEGYQDTPLSISAVSGDELQALESVNLPSILKRLGNVNQSPGNPRTFSLAIRGVGLSVASGDAIDPSVGITADGVSYASPSFATGINLIDLESVEVTRGPLGTLGGKNSNLGGINIVTKSPSFTPEAWASVTYGDWNTLDTKAVFGGPIIEDKLAWRGTFYRDQEDGPYKNIYNKNYTYQNRDLTYGRLQFLATPTTNFSARISLDYAPVGRELSDTYLNYNRATPDYYDTGKAVNQANQPVGKLSRRWFTREANYNTTDYLADEINRNLQLRSNFGTKGASANLTWDVDNFTLTSISAYKNYTWECENGEVTVFNINRRGSSCAIVDYTQLSQEFRINSPLGNFIDYQAGLYFLKTDSDYQSEAGEKGSDAGAYYANDTQYARLDTTTSGQVIMQNSLERLITRRTDNFTSTSPAVYGNINWHFTDPFTVSTGLRLTQEIRHDNNSQSFVVDQGYGSDLNPAAVNNVQLGGFNNDATGNLAINNAEQLALADSVAKKYFGAANYAALSAVQKRQVADAKTIRLAQLGTLYQNIDAESFNKVLPTFNIIPSYKFNDNYTGYLSWRHGEKSGGSQIIGATINGGKSLLVKPEKSDAYELGLKTVLLDRTLVINADVFVNNIKDFQQSMYFYDEAQTIANADNRAAYSAGLGNVPKVQIKGFELDVGYSGIPFTTLRFAGAYNEARYKDFEFLAKPAELNDGVGTPYFDATGKMLPNSPRLTFNLSGEFVHSISQNWEAHTNINYHYTGEFNADPSLSRYAVVDSYGLTDFGVGLGRKDGFFDLNLVVKNLFDVDYGYLSNWNTFIPSYPRWVGATATFKL